MTAHEIINAAWRELKVLPEEMPDIESALLKLNLMMENCKYWVTDAAYTTLALDDTSAFANRYNEIFIVRLAISEGPLVGTDTTTLQSLMAREARLMAELHYQETLDRCFASEDQTTKPDTKPSMILSYNM